MPLAAVLGDWQEAEDALQEGLWRAFCGLPRLRAPEAFDGWLQNIVLNAARDHLRAAVARIRREGVPHGDITDLDQLVTPPPQGFADDLLDREACNGILQSIARLPRRERRLAMLAWVAGVPPRTVAELLGVSPAAARVALHRARRRLQSALATATGFQRGVERVEDGTVLLVGETGLVDHIIEHLRTARPDLRVARSPEVRAGHVRVGTTFYAAMPTEVAPPPTQKVLPLDTLAEAAGFDLGPYESRLLRFSWGGRPYWLPHHATTHVVVYNGDLLSGAGVPLPSPDWTWDDFFALCRRCLAAGVTPLTSDHPNSGDLALVAEQLGATACHLQPVREAVTFVRRWRESRFSAPSTEGQWALEPFYAGRTAMTMTSAGHPASALAQSQCRPFRWGIAPIPRSQRSDAHLPYWSHEIIGVQGTAPDPMEAFRLATAIIIAGPAANGGQLPVYRTPAALRSWRKLPLPIGKDCLFELDACTDPLFVPARLWWIRGARDIFDRLLSGELTPTAGIAALEAASAAQFLGAAGT